MDRLSKDVLRYILSFLPALELVKLSYMNREFRILCNEEVLWKTIVQKMRWEDPDNTLPASYKSRFITKFTEQYVHEQVDTDSGIKTFLNKLFGNSSKVVSYVLLWTISVQISYHL
jgi:hypothetical protein